MSLSIGENISAVDCRKTCLCFNSTKLSKQLIHDASQIQLTSAADLKIKFGTNVRTGVVSVGLVPAT